MRCARSVSAIDEVQTEYPPRHTGPIMNRIDRNVHTGKREPKRSDVVNIASLEIPSIKSFQQGPELPIATTKKPKR
jgi:hypothetical protein